MTYAELYITDGTTEINLLDNWNLLAWRPKIAPYKEGGYWRESPFAHGRRPVFRRYGSVVEEFPLILKRFDPDSLAYEFRTLRKLLEDAFDYWAPGSISSSPVYLAARKYLETNTRYSLVYAGAFPEDIDLSNPSVESCQELMAAGYTLYIERAPFWGKEIPGTLTAIEMSSYDTFDGVDLGVQPADATTDPNVFSVNAQGTTNITDIFLDDGGVFSSNLLGSGVPYNLLPAVPAVDDAVYFLSDQSSAGNHPFWNLIFQLDQAASDVTIVWETYDDSGAAWSALDADAGYSGGAEVIDETQGFTQTGVKSLYFRDTSMEESFATINGVTGWVIRARVSAIGASPTPPRQNTRDVYTVSWNWLEIANDQITGELPARAKLKIYCQSNRGRNSGQFTNDYAFIDTVYWATRLKSRGSDFTPFLNLGQRGRASGQTNDISAAIYSSYIEDSKSLTCSCVEATRGAIASDVSLITTRMDIDFANNYIGKFHVYIRALTNQAVASDLMDIKLKVSVGYPDSNTFWESEYRPVRGVVSQLAPDLVDLGRLDLPPGGLSPGDSVQDIYFRIYGDFKHASATVRLYDIVLMPVDEYFGVVQEQQDNTIAANSGMGLDNYLEIDSIAEPRSLIYSPVKLRADDTLAFSFQGNVPLEFTIPAGESVRLWFLSEHYEITFTGDKVAAAYQLIKAQAWIYSQYLGSIGADD